MRHRVYGKHLGRNKDQRKNLFKGLIYSLFSHGTIQTSEVKAKAIKGLVDKVITLGKSKQRLTPRELGVKDTQDRLQSFISDKALRERLMKEIIPQLGKRTSGYTSVVKLGNRLGDQAMMVRMSLIGAEELKPVVKELKVKTGKTKEKKVKVVASPKKPIQTKTVVTKKRIKKT